MLIFAAGSRQQNISVFITEDDIPETDEPLLYNPLTQQVNKLYLWQICCFQFFYKMALLSTSLSPVNVQEQNCFTDFLREGVKEYMC